VRSGLVWRDPVCVLGIWRIFGLALWLTAFDKSLSGICKHDSALATAVLDWVVGNDGDGNSLLTSVSTLVSTPGMTPCRLNEISIISTMSGFVV